MNTLGFPGMNQPMLPQGGFASQMPQNQGMAPNQPMVMGQRSPVMPPKVITIPVSPGDSLSNIAQRYGTTVGTIQYMNGIRNPDEIFAGRMLTVPNPQLTGMGMSQPQGQPQGNGGLQALMQQIGR